MTYYDYRLVNVFAPSVLTGNALCVFENAEGMSDEVMQALALQFNLSETTFLQPSDRASARLRIFSPSAEFPFAGHPVLGSAAVVAQQSNAAETLTLETNAGIIPVTFSDQTYTLKANAPRWRPVRASAAELASMLNLPQDALGAPALWVSTGFEQLLIPLRSTEALTQVRLDSTQVQRFSNESGLVKIYLWAEAESGFTHARFFFTRDANVIGEDPGTGSACANLGGWLIATGAKLPHSRTIYQGDHLRRPCRLHLSLNMAGEIFVSGQVIEVGRGRVQL